ncbi:hypothetical protein VW608_005867 [Pseudomonas aeruginosa]|uniref:hypothetical protein n=1 Tax=Pseudomonas aeruginosa TaxID=287 RepID=UPI001CD525D2|nr:hypothetical protein [Pseudomonas aeruginosa]EMD8986195.1 hypothetical protein [Pseudomonas aeruginosa]HBO1943254.1 hypothetical protein [Pseudomonas aeruginosa]
MSKQSHTPGPWRLDKWGSLQTEGGQNVLLRGITTISSGSDELIAEAEANTRLTSAAPELLDALEDAVNRLTSSLILLKCDDDFIKKETAKARAAIAKATA